MYSLVKPLLFQMDAEKAHTWTVGALARLPLGTPPAPSPMLQTNIAGLSFPNPVGLAAGFDKDARVWRQMLGLGFGSVEVGTLTPRPQAGNLKPRLFRLPEDKAIINRMGFNNGGLSAALPRLAPHPLLGVNVGANKDSPSFIADYVKGIGMVRGVASWITLNISSPNTPHLRDLQGEALPELLAAATEARGAGGPPLFLKVAPDMDAAAIDAIVAAVLAADVAALIVSNTTVSRQAALHSAMGRETGGLSGAPLFAPSTAILGEFAKRLAGRLPLVGVGGVARAEDAYAKIRAGASMVQLYSAMVYEGPFLAREIVKGLKLLLARDGFKQVGEAVGSAL